MILVVDVLDYLSRSNTRKPRTASDSVVDGPRLPPIGENIWRRRSRRPLQPNNGGRYLHIRIVSVRAGTSDVSEALRTPPNDEHHFLEPY